MLDLSSVSALDGAGLGLLAFLAGWTRVIGIKLKVLNPSGRVRQLLELTHLDSVLEFCDSEFSSELVAQSASTVTADALLHR
jgi:anti-anti-sigma factor